MADIILLIIRWLHAVAAVAWIGGGIFYWVVLGPALRSSGPSRSVARFAGPEFGQVVTLAMGVLLITGAILAFDRLTAQTATAAYVSVLVVKIVLAAWMFGVVWVRQRGAPELPPEGSGRLRVAVDTLTSTNATVVVGLVVFLLSDILRLLIERGLED